MAPASFFQRLSPFEKALLWSAGFHAALFLFGLKWNLFPARDDFEYIDITGPVRIVDDPSQARKARNPRPGGSITASPALKAAVAPVQVPAVPADAIKPVDTITPTPMPAPADTVPLTKPGDLPTGAETGEGVGGDGFGDGTGGAGEVDLVHLTTLPQLLEKEKFKALVRRNYPPKELSAGQEGWVRVVLYLDPAGRVRKFDVESASSEAFAAVAPKVLNTAAFSPAYVNKRAVPVKIPWTIHFKME